MTVLTDFSPDSVIPAIDDGLAAYRTLYARGPGGRMDTSHGALRIDTGLLYIRFNGIFRARLSESDTDTQIDALIAPLMGRIPFQWWVSPASAPANLGDRLAAHGLTRARETPAMAMQITRAPKPEPTPGFTIRRAADVDEFTAATPVIFDAFGIPAEYLPNMIAIERGAWAAGDHTRHIRLTAWDGDQPVATGSLTDADGVASLDAIATRPGYQGRGLASAMTLALLELARQRGYAIAVLEASPKGLPVYRRVGFEVFCNYTVYTHAPTAPG